MANPLPRSPQPPQPVVGKSMNSVPGRTDTYYFGGNLLRNLHDWCVTAGKGDFEGAVAPGQAILQHAANNNAAPEAVKALFDAMQSVMHTTQSVDNLKKSLEALKQGAMNAVPGMPGGQNDADKGSDEGLSWIEPNPNMFYSLDDKSGRQLVELLDDLRCVDRYIARGAPAPNRQLFVGAPGNGKTTGIFWLGTQLNIPVALIRLDGVASSLVGKKEKNMRACFETAKTRPCIIALDEFESVAVPRSNQGANVGQWSRDCTSALLQLVDSLPPEQAFFGCTNHPELIDTAVLDRMRDIIYFYPPNRETRAHMVKEWWTNAPHKGEAKRVLLDMTEGMSGRRFQNIVHVANRIAARRGAKEDITVADVEKAVSAALGEAAKLSMSTETVTNST